MSAMVRFYMVNTGAPLGLVGVDGAGKLVYTSTTVRRIVESLCRSAKISPVQAVDYYAAGWSNGAIASTTETPPTATSVEKGHPHPGQRYTHGWKPVAETLFDADHHYGHTTVSMSVRSDGSASAFVNDSEMRFQNDSEMRLQVEDIPDLVDALDSHLTRHEAGDRDEPTRVPTSAGHEIEISSPRPDRVEVQFETADGDLAAIVLTPDEVEQFTADLEELAAQYQPQVLHTTHVSDDLTLNLLSHDRVGADGSDLTLSHAEVPDVAAALDRLAGRYADLPQEWDPDGHPMHVDERDLGGGLMLRWLSDGSAVLERGDMEMTIPAGQSAAAVAALRGLEEHLGPRLTAKGHRLVRQLAKQAGVSKEQGTVGQYRARHLRRWFERGEGAARIAWGTPGDFDRCVAIAAEHMRGPEGYCNLRHKGALGFYPATHAAMERGNK